MTWIAGAKAKKHKSFRIEHKDKECLVPWLSELKVMGSLLTREVDTMSPMQFRMNKADKALRSTASHRTQEQHCHADASCFCCAQALDRGDKDPRLPTQVWTEETAPGRHVFLTLIGTVRMKKWWENKDRDGKAEWMKLLTMAGQHCEETSSQQWRVSSMGETAQDEKR